MDNQEKIIIDKKKFEETMNDLLKDDVLKTLYTTIFGENK